MTKLVIEEKEMVTRIQVRIPKINLNALSKNMPGNFTKPETPNQYAIIVPQLENQKLIFTMNKIYSIMKPSVWERIKGDFRQFLDDIAPLLVAVEWEKFKHEDLKGIRRDIKRVRGALK